MGTHFQRVRRKLQVRQPTSQLTKVLFAAPEVHQLGAPGKVQQHLSAKEK